MLKSRGRTNEVFVMNMEECPQVGIESQSQSIAIRIAGKTKSVAPETEVMPYAERERKALY